MWITKPSFVTFITPSKGRNSLNKTVQSLVDQTDWNWRSIIVFDGIAPIELEFDYLLDNHFIVYSIAHQGHAGLVRNFALPLVDTRWTAFVDDDDFLKNTYVSSLKDYETKNPNIDIFIFTYKDVENGNTRPPKGLSRIKCCEVGISFAIKTSFIKEKGVTFNLGGVEDWAFLRDCENLGANILITHDTQYFVGHRSSWT